MAVAIAFFSIIVPISTIEKHYPGGFDQYKKDKSDDIPNYIWYDNYLVREGAMGSLDIDDIITGWEKLGANITTEVNGKTYWDELCLVDDLFGLTMDCDWVSFTPEENAYLNFRQEKYAYLKGTFPAPLRNWKNSKTPPLKPMENPNWAKELADSIERNQKKTN